MENVYFIQLVEFEIKSVFFPQKDFKFFKFKFILIIRINNTQQNI